MFKWLLYKLGLYNAYDDTQHVHVHIDGAIRIIYEGRQNIPGTLQGSVNSSTPTENQQGNTGIDKNIEGSVGPEFFASIDTPQITFGTEIELPPSESENEDN
ncbi:MAG: hypothetical protein QXP41_00495 [Candidatus Nitrosocaldus sp.]